MISTENVSEVGLHECIKPPPLSGQRTLENFHQFLLGKFLGGHVGICRQSRGQLQLAWALQSRREYGKWKIVRDRVRQEHNNACLRGLPCGRSASISLKKDNDQLCVGIDIDHSKLAQS